MTTDEMIVLFDERVDRIEFSDMLYQELKGYGCGHCELSRPAFERLIAWLAQQLTQEEA